MICPLGMYLGMTFPPVINSVRPSPAVGGTVTSWRKPYGVVTGFQGDASAFFKCGPSAQAGKHCKVGVSGRSRTCTELADFGVTARYPSYWVSLTKYSTKCYLSIRKCMNTGCRNDPSGVTSW